MPGGTTSGISGTFMSFPVDLVLLAEAGAGAGVSGYDFLPFLAGAAAGVSERGRGFLMAEFEFETEGVGFAAATDFSLVDGLFICFAGVFVVSFTGLEDDAVVRAGSLIRPELLLPESGAAGGASAGRFLGRLWFSFGTALGVAVALPPTFVDVFFSAGLTASIGGVASIPLAGPNTFDCFSGVCLVAVCPVLFGRARIMSESESSSSWS